MTTVTWKEGDDGKLWRWEKRVNFKRPEGHEGPYPKQRLKKEEVSADWTTVETPTGSRYYVYDENHETNLYMTRECAEKYIPEGETIEVIDEDNFGWGTWVDVSTDPELDEEDIEYIGTHTIKLSINQLNPLDEDDRYDDGYTINEEWLLRSAGIHPEILNHPGFEGGSWCDG